MTRRKHINNEGKDGKRRGSRRGEGKINKKERLRGGGGEG